MAKATTLKASGLKAKASLGTILADAFHTSKASRAAAEDDFKAKLGTIESAWITLLKGKASEHENMTAAEYDATVHPDVCKRLESLGYKVPRVVASQVKVAFLAFCHGVEVKPEYATNFQKFVNNQARPELGEMKVIKHTPKGASGKTKVASKKAAPGPVDLFANLFKGDKVARAWRAEALRAIVNADPQGKLFDSMLGDILDTLEIEVE